MGYVRCDFDACDISIDLDDPDGNVMVSRAPMTFYFCCETHAEEWCAEHPVSD
jgi:hypothetical protein